MLNKRLSRLAAKMTLLVFTIPALASNNTNYKDETPQSFVPYQVYGSAYIGYGNIEGADHENGQIALGRLALGIFMIHYDRFSFGIEAGWQTGNDMILSESQSLFDATAFMPVQATLKPMLDLLITSKTYVLQNQPLALILNAGIAYRQLQLVDRTSSEDHVRRINAELQAGLGYNLTKNAMIIAFYQGIYSGSNADLGLDSNGDITIGRIPTEQAGFIGLEYSI